MGEKRGDLRHRKKENELSRNEEPAVKKEKEAKEFGKSKTR